MLACIRLRAETLASLPLVVYRRTSNGGKDRADDHDAYAVLHDAFNPYMTSYTARNTMHAQTVGRGNCYGLIERDGGGRTRAIWPVPAGAMLPKIVDGKLWYPLTEYGVEILGVKPGMYRAADVIHVAGLGWDGVRGYNPIELAREAIGVAIAAEKFGARFFGAGARASGVVTTDLPLDKPKARELRDSLNEIHEGVYNSHKLMLMTHGMKYSPMSVNPDDAQFLETRGFQIAEIARLFRLSPHMIGASTDDSQTYANVENRMIEFVTLSLRPDLVAWEQELNRKLFTPREQSRYFVEFNVDALLRGDISARYSAYQTGIGSRFLTRNEVRARENLNPIDGGDVIDPIKAPTKEVAQA